MAKTVATPIAPRSSSGKPPEAAVAPRTRTAPIKVRATQMGYYDHKRRREGDVFTISDESVFSTKWMVRVAPTTPEKLTTGKEALEREHDRILSERATGASRVPPAATDEDADDHGDDPVGAGE